MMEINATRLRTAAALTLLAVYTWMKYSAGGVAFSWAYAQQVLVIVTLTALLPYALTRVAERFAGRLKWTVRIVLPSLLACAGYWTFFTIAIAPYAPDASAIPVVLRGLTPGIVITLLLSLPDIVALRARPSKSVAAAN